MVFAVTDISLPVPETEGQNPIKIFVNNVQPQGGSVYVSNKTLTIKMENIKTGTDFYVGINKSLPQKLSQMPSSKQTPKGPPFDYIADNLSKGVLFKIENIDKITTKSFSINNWDAVKSIQISVCQDKNEDGDCEESDEKSTVSINLKKFEAASCNTINSCLSVLGKKFVFYLLETN